MSLKDFLSDKNKNKQNGYQSPYFATHLPA